jgi:dTDP-4-amino-4,6-dideoxygalactose transaminase
MVEPLARHRKSIFATYVGKLHERLVSKETSAKVRERSGFVNCPILVEPHRRNAIYKKIFSSGFDVGLSLYPNVHELDGFRHITGRSENVSRLVRSVITLPTHPRISEEYAARLGNVIQHAAECT